MKIGIYNNQLKTNIFDSYSIIDSLNAEGIDMLLVYWKKNIEGERSSFEQLALIDLCLKKQIPIKIIDLNREMLYDEAFTAIKSGISLYEPYLITRRFFKYLPESVSLDFPELENIDRPINIMYHTTPKLAFTALNVQIIDNVFTGAKCYLNCDSLDYRVNGRISPQTFIAASSGCIPLIPVEHKYFHGLMTPVGSPVIAKDVQFYVNRALAIGYGYCHGFIENTKINFSEFSNEYFKDIILNDKLYS